MEACHSGVMPASDVAPSRSPRLASDALRSWVALLIATVVGTLVLLALAVLGDPEEVLAAGLGLRTTIFLIGYYLAYLGLTWVVFIRRDPTTLRQLIRASNARRHASVERLSGADPITFVLTAVGFALVTVSWMLIDPATKASPPALALAGAMVALAWIVMQVSGTILLLRLDVERTTLQFPDERMHGWTDYSYVATQLLATSSTADVQVCSTVGRRAATTLTVAALVFNTIVVALLVAGFLGLAN